MDPRTPVIVAAGQHTNFDALDPEPRPGMDPIDLMVEALRNAAADSHPLLVEAFQSIGVVPVISWRYSDPAAEVARRLGTEVYETVLGPLGGHAPVRLLNRLARKIAAGEIECGAVVGGEAWRTRRNYRKLGSTPPWWSQPADEVPSSQPEPGKDEMFHPAELATGLVMPTQFYPLFENALRHESGRSFEDHQRWVGSWWAPMSEVAAENPYAWKAEARSVDEVITPTSTNRMVGLPYTKSMVSNPDVDMGAGFIMCSAEMAQRLGIQRDRWVFVHSGTDGVDRFPSNRASFTGSASMRVAGTRALELAGTTVDDLDLLDVYSCFPSAIEIAAKELNFTLDRPLTVYGGLCFAGGPWNNPVGHAIAAMYDKIRDGQGRNGLVTANGGNVGKHGFVVLSNEPATTGYRWDHPQAEIDAEPPVPVAQGYVGAAEIETWTVMFDREGRPETAHAAVRTPAGERTWARTGDKELAERLSTGEWIGTAVSVGENATLLT